MDEVGRGALAGPVSRRRRASSTRRAGPRRSGSRTPSCSRLPHGSGWSRRSGDGRAPGPSATPRRPRSTRSASWPRCGWRAPARWHSCAVVPDLVILDGNHDWLTDPAKVGLLAFARGGADVAGTAVPPVTTLVKADLTCSSVAAASVLAKVERDAMMVALAAEVGTYSWERQQGLLRARAPGRAVRARCRASTTAGRGGCPGARARGRRRAGGPRGRRGLRVAG